MRLVTAGLAALLLAPSAAFAQQAVIAPGENLVADAVPAIPASLADEVRRYTEARSASFEDWHPTRREMLVSTRFGNAPQIHHVTTPGGARRQVTFFDEPITSAVYEPRQGRYFLFLKDVGGNEFSQVYRYDLADGRATVLTGGGRTQNGLPTFNPAGDLAAYASTRRNGADRDIWLMNPADSASSRILMQNTGGGWSVEDWSPDGRTLLVREYESVTRSHLWTVDIRSRSKARITPRARDVACDGARFAPDGRRIYVTTDVHGEFLTLSVLDPANGRVTPLTGDIPWDVTTFELSPDGGTIAFVANEEGVDRLYLLDTSTGEHRRVDGLPLGTIGDLRWRPSGGELGFTLNSSRSPSDTWSLDARTGALTRWTESELGGLVPSELSEPELVRWRSFDGREITGFLYRPAARFTGPRPVIINIHGGPESQSRPGFQGRSNYFLNEMGVAILYPNVRGSTGYGKSFAGMDNGMKREDSVRDIGALLDWIGTRPELDAGRVLVTGGSYGGYMTLAVATNYADRICCALDVVGISHFGTFLRNTESYRRDLRRAEYGDERQPQMAAYFERISPLNNAARITRPLFVAQGGNDPRVPRTEAEQIVERVKRNGTPVWYLMARDEGHGFRKKANQDYQFYATILFIRQHLLRE